MYANQMNMFHFRKTSCRILQSRRMKHGDGTPVNARNSWTRRSRLGLAGSLAGWIGVAAGLLLSYGEAPAQVISRVSTPGKFYVDDKASIGLLFNYAAYLISNNTAATFPSVYVAITNIGSSNLIQIGASDTGVRALGALAPGQAKMAAFYLKGPSLTGNAQSLLNLTNENHTILAMNGPPGVGSVLSSANFGFTNIIFVIEALANKINTITNLNPYALLGSQVQMLIQGDTGT